MSDGEGGQDLRELEQRADRLDLVSRWADDLAHEIKNPLHAMVINLELVKRRALSDDPKAAVQRAEVVESELHRVHALVDSLLRLIRPWPDAGTAAVHDVFQALLPVFRARSHIRKIAYSHESGTAFASIPPGDLAHALVHLLDRALAATPEGGHVHTAVAGDEDRITITVRDSGGDHSEEGGRSSVAVTRSLLERYGGTLELHTVEGGGTEARVLLPPTGAA